MAYNAENTFSQDLSNFGGKVGDIAAGNAPAGVSVDCRDMFFSAQYTATRPALQHALAATLSSGHDILSHADYPQNTGQTETVMLYDDGSLWTKNIQTNTTTQVGTVSPNTRFKAIAAFDKFFMAFRSLALTSPFTSAQLCGGDVPRYINSLGHVWRVTSDAPGGGFAVSGVNIAPEDLVSVGTFVIGPPITNITLTDPKTIIVNNPGTGPQTITQFTTASITLQSPGYLVTVGQAVELYSINWQSSNGPQWANGVPVLSVTDAQHFKIAITPVTQFNSATSGTFAYAVAANTGSSSFQMIQSGTANTTGVAPNTSFTLPKPVTAGNSIIVAVETYSETTPPTISDNRSNSYSLVASVTDGSYRNLLYLATGVAAGSTTVNCGISGGQSAASFTAINVHEAAGILTPSSVDVSNTNSGLQSGMTFNSGTITTTNANDVIFSFVTSIGDSAFAPGGYTQSTNLIFNSSQGTQQVSTAFQVVTTTQTISPTWGRTGANFNGIGITAAFKVQPLYFATPVQSTTGSVQNGGSGSQTLTITFPHNVTEGNTIVLSVGSFDHLGGGNPDPSPTVHDTQSNGYAQAAQATHSGQEQTTTIFVASGLASSGPLSITMSFSTHQFNSYIVANATEFKGILTPGPVDTAASSYQQSGTTFDSGSVTTTNANDIIVSCVHNAVAHGAVPGTPAGFSAIANQVVPQPNGLNGSDPVLATAVQIVSQTGTTSPTWTMAQMNGGGCTVALQLAPSGTKEPGGEALIRQNNIVTAFLAGTSPANPTQIQAGWFVSLVDTQASANVQLPDGSVPFLGNELFQAIYPSSAGMTTVPTLLTGTTCTFYPVPSSYGGAFPYDYPGDGNNLVLPTASSQFVLQNNDSLLFNPNGSASGTLLNGAPNSYSQQPMQVYGVATTGTWDGTSQVIWSGATQKWGMAVVGSMVFPQAGTYTIRIVNDAGCLMGFEAGVTPVSQNPGAVQPLPHTKTALNGFGLCFAQNASVSFGHVSVYDTQVQVQVNAAGTYQFEIDYASYNTGHQILAVLTSNGSGGWAPIQPTSGPGQATVQGDGLGNIHVKLPVAVEALPIGSWLYLVVNSPTPSFVTNWTISSNGTGLITVPNSQFSVGTQIVLNGFTSVKNPQPTGWNGQTVTITAVEGTTYQFNWSGTAGTGTTTSGTATPVSSNYPTGWVQVTQVISTDEFVYFAQGVTNTLKSTGVVYDYFGSLNTQQSLTNNGITNSQQSNSGIVQGFQVLSVDRASTPNTITWYQAGFNDSYTGQHILQVQPQTQIAGGPRSLMVYFINEDGGATPGSYPINLQLNGGSEFAQVELPIGPPGTVARGTAWTAAYGTAFFSLRPGNIPAQAGNGPIISTGTIVFDNTTTATIIDFSDQALVNGIFVGPSTAEADATGDDFGDLTATIVLPPCIGVIEYNQQLAWWGELNNLPNHSMINMGFDGGYDGIQSIGVNAQPLGWDNTTTVASIAPDQTGFLVNSQNGLGWSYAMPINGATILRFALFSPSQGSLAIADFTISSFTATSQWYSQAFTLPMPSSIPTDTQFYVTLIGGSTTSLISQGAYQDYYGVPCVLPNRSYVMRLQALSNGTYVAIDELEIIDAAQPVLGNQLRLSYIDNEFGYDNVNGFTVGLDTSDFIAGCFLQRSYLYAITDGIGELHTVQANGQKPADWSTAMFSKECGCSGPDAVATTGTVAWWMGRQGVHGFEGQHAKKISQPVANDFERTNWNAAVNGAMAYDAIERILYMSFPTGTAINPNFLHTMSTRLADATYNVPDPIHVSSYTGKIISTDLSQKWCQWSLPINSMAMSLQSTPQGFAKVMTFAGGSPDGIAHYGQLYTQDFVNYPPTNVLATTWNCIDADYSTIPWHYQTYFFFAHDTEQQAQLSLYRKLFAYFSIHVMGVGFLNTTPYVDNLNNPWPALAPAKMATTNTTFQDPSSDWNMGLNVTGNRMSLRFSGTPVPSSKGGDNLSSAMLLTHLIVSARKDLVFPADGLFGAF